MPAPTGSADLTGATRYRSGWFGGLVLQVEVKFVAYYKGRLSPFEDRTPVYDTKWRDATTKDIRLLEWLEMKRAREARGEHAPAPLDRYADGSV